jgi:hypothetical protein
MNGSSGTVKEGPMIRGFKYIFFPALAVGLATMSATAADEAVVPLSGQHGIASWQVDGNSGLWLHARDGQWFYARTEASCLSLESATQIGFRASISGGLDRSGALVAAGENGPLSSVVRSDKPTIAIGG